MNAALKRAAAVAAGLSLACSMGLAGCAPASTAGSGSAGSAVAAKAAVSREIKITQKAPGMTEGTSHTIVHVTGEGEDGSKADFYHAVTAKDAMSGKGSLELAEGSYEVSFLPTVNPDGSINRGSTEAVKVEVKDGAKEEPSASHEGETVPADQVTADDIADVQEKVDEAVKKGDSTLAGDAGKDVADEVASNASNAPAAKRDEIEAKRDETSGAAASSKGDAAKPSQPAAKKDDSGSKKDAASSGAASKPASKPASGSAKPAHEHKWVAQYREETVYRTEPVYETRTRTVVDQEAWTEQVIVGEHAMFSDGHEEWTGLGVAEYEKKTGLSYKSVPTYETVSHPAVSHQESYQVQTGTKQVPNGTKKVLTGYKCSTCGATK